jgi:hypothetical protein
MRCDSLRGRAYRGMTLVTGQRFAACRQTPSSFASVRGASIAFPCLAAPARAPAHSYPKPRNSASNTITSEKLVPSTCHT